MANNHLIPLDQAAEMTKYYRSMKEEILAAKFKNKNILPICETFDRDAFDNILQQNGCKKVRIYFGMDDNELVKMVVVGVNDQDADMLPANDPVIIEMGIRCPNICPPSSSLNT